MTTEKTREAIYYVVEGDTLSRIAERFRTTVAKLQQLNHIPDVNLIHPGQRLIVSQSGNGFVPFPGAEWFHHRPENAVVLAMAHRLEEESCSAYSPPEPDKKWSAADKASYSNWQRKMGFSGADADGIPGKTSWDELRIPTPPA